MKQLNKFQSCTTWYLFFLIIGMLIVIHPVDAASRQKLTVKPADVEIPKIEKKFNEAKITQGEKIINVLPAAFSPTSNDFKYNLSGEALTRKRDSVYRAASFIAPLQLPHGANIQRMVMFCDDPYQHINTTVTLYRFANDGSESEKLAFLTSYGSAEKGNIRKFIANDFVENRIDNTRHYYYLKLVLEGDLEFRGLKIIYTEP